MICDEDPLRRRPRESTARRKRQERCVWMARKMTEWPSKRGPITKIMPSDGCIGDTVPLAVGKWYDFHEFGWYMGNVGLYQGAMIETHRDGFPRFSALSVRRGDAGHRKACATTSESLGKPPFRSSMRPVGGRRKALTMRRIASGFPPTRRTAWTIPMGLYHRSLVLPDADPFHSSGSVVSVLSPCSDMFRPIRSSSGETRSGDRRLISHSRQNPSPKAHAPVAATP